MLCRKTKIRETPSVTHINAHPLCLPTHVCSHVNKSDACGGGPQRQDMDLGIEFTKVSLHLERPSSLRTAEQCCTHGSEDHIPFCPRCVTTFYQIFL